MLQKKSLGQHFLTSKHYLGLIADSANIKAGERVLEVGPGDGTLTAELLSRGAIVTAIEKDARLIPVLKEKFAKEISEKRFLLHEADAVRFDISKYIKGKYKVVANIPYYITGALLKKFLSEQHQPSDLILLVQKEVAERIARSKKESILSLSVKVYGAPSYIKTVPRGAFSPPPSVDSAILGVYDISYKNFEAKTLSDKVRPTPREAAFRERRFFEIVRAGFAQKRKLLVRNLEKIFGDRSSDILQKVGISKNARAEDVPLAQWLALSKVEELSGTSERKTPPIGK